MAIVDLTAAEEQYSSQDDHCHEEEEDPDANNKEQLQFDAEVSGIAGLDLQYNGADVYHQKWL